MPIFEYRCESCDHQFEALLLRTSPPPRCPECQSEELQKLISMYAVNSETTRNSAKRGQKARNERVRTEIAHEEHKRFHDHDH